MAEAATGGDLYPDRLALKVFPPLTGPTRLFTLLNVAAGLLFLTVDPATAVGGRFWTALGAVMVYHSMLHVGIRRGGTWVDVTGEGPPE